MVSSSCFCLYFVTASEFALGPTTPPTTMQAHGEQLIIELSDADTWEAPWESKAISVDRIATGVAYTRPFVKCLQMLVHAPKPEL